MATASTAVQKQTWHAEAIKFARRMANVATDLDRLQWLAILAAVESLASEAGVEVAVVAEPPRKQIRHLPMVEQVAKAA